MLLRWEQKDLAIKSGMSLPNIKRLETIPGELAAWESTINAIRRAFENEGIRFIGGSSRGLRRLENRGEPGARRFAPAVSAPGRRSKPAKPIKKAVAKKARGPRPNRLK
jgi:hypothetical protein